MKRFVLFFLLLSFLTGNTTIYYSQGSLAPNLTTSWNSIRLGGGTTPTDFLGAGDEFVIQSNHTMTTTATWQLGGSTSKLQIEAGGILIGNNSIQLPNLAFVFQIDDGGKYVHNNNNSIASTPGASIWAGTEAFSVNSSVEIQNWINNLAMIPAGISWGNLIINLTNNLSGSWNQAGNVTTIQSNLQIISSGTVSGQEFRITGSTNTVLNIGGNIIIDGGILNIKTMTVAGTSCIVEVAGGISVNNTGTLNVGVADVVPNAELRFKGNFSASATATVTSGNIFSYLVANGTTTQSLTCPVIINCHFRIVSGATVNLSSTLTTGSGKKFIVLGTFNDNGFSKTFDGTLEVPGGIFNSTGNVIMGANYCYSCSGDGSYISATETWCTGTGTKGRINFSNNIITFNQSSSSALSAGLGDIYFINSRASFTAGSGGTGYTGVGGNGSVLSLDDNSYIEGNANYTGGSGGTLRIGSPDGITATGNTTNGNIRVSGLKSYNNSGISNFEYFGTSQQATGTGLPSTVNGTLKINNTASLSTSGVTLSQNVTVSGILDLTLGKLTSSSSAMLNLADGATAINYTTSSNSFVSGPMRKTGDETFEFPVGKGVSIHTAALTQGSGAATDVLQVEYFQGDPRSGGYLFSGPGGGIDHISRLEYWEIGNISGTPTKQATLMVTTFSDATDLSRLLIVHYTGGGWANYGNTAFSGTPGLGFVTSINTSNYGRFTFGSADPFPVNPLPIDLISFDASKLTNTQSSINWELAACCSAAAKFEIQGAGANKNFISITTIGGSETNKLYNYIDNGLRNGINYYRLKMIDEDGKITYSRTVAVMNGVNGLLLTSLIPTVVINTATLTIASSGQQKLDLIIVDMQGRMMMKRNYTIAAGNSSIELSLNGLAAGAYQLTGITAEGKTNTIRFIRQ